MKAIQSFKSAEEIAVRCQQLAEMINKHYQDIVSVEDPLMVVGVLSGSFIFMADLVRLLTVPVEIHWVKVNSYQGNASLGALNWQLNVRDELRGKHLLIVEDIIDTGLTLHEVLKDLESRLQPASLKIAALLHKKVRSQFSVTADFLGFEIPDAFVVGFGLDYNGRYRELPYIGIVQS